MKRLIPMFVLMGCASKDPDADWYTDSGGMGSNGSGWGSSPSFNLAWTDTGNTLEASVSNPHPDGYFLGLAETGSGSLGWYGEDCVSDDAICHDMGGSNFVSLMTVHPDISGRTPSEARAAVEDGIATLFHVGLWEGVTYVFFSNEGDTGYNTIANVGGDDTSYYQ